MILFWASLFAAVIPMIIYLSVIWKMDKYEPEPIKFVLAHFLWGGFGAIIFAIIGSSAVAWIMDVGFELQNKSLLMTILTAPILEEITKGIFLTKTFKDERFDNITDGLVYGGAIGLGFGMTENFFYFITYGDTFNEWASIVVIRTGFSAVMHCISTGIFGAFLGYVKYLPIRRKMHIASLGLLLAMFIHLFWNLSVSFNSTYQYGIIFIFVMILVFIALFQLSLMAERKILKVELYGEVPDEMIKFISTNGRYKKGWIEESLRMNFIKDCTKLAFRKRQFRSIKSDDKIEAEIALLRENLKLYFDPQEKEETI